MQRADLGRAAPRQASLRSRPAAPRPAEHASRDGAPDAASGGGQGAGVVEIRAPGLKGVTIADSAIAYIDGDQGILVYRGFDIGELAEHATFEETLFLLWHDRLPTREELAKLHRDLRREMSIPDEVVRTITDMRTAHPMATLRTAVSMLAAFDPDAEDNSLDAELRKSLRLVAKTPTIVAGTKRAREGRRPVEPDPSISSIAAAFMYMLEGERPSDVVAKAMDTALVLHAEHGYNASTFAARVVASTAADMHGAVVAGLGALKGPLHGGANQEVMRMLLEIGDPKNARAYIEARLKNEDKEKRKVPGIGHRIYRALDPRAKHLKKFSKQLGEALGASKWFEISEIVEQLATDALKEKRLYPNVDFYSASTYYSMGIPFDLFTPIFAISRMAGWTAHVIEQRNDNALLRPLSTYTGPMGRKYQPIDKR